jgi:hypothetical protein
MMTKLEPPQIRATTGLELAAGIFAKCSDGLAKQLSISLTAGKRESGTSEFRIGINGDIYGGLLAPIEVGTRKVDIAYVNPSAMVAMAYLGKGIYQDKLPLRVLGCFPSWDRIALVVDKNLGVKSLYDVVSVRFRCMCRLDSPASTMRPIIRLRRSCRFTGSALSRSRSGAGKCKSAAGRSRRSA